MADLSKVKLNGTTYNFKDSQIRENVGELTDLNTIDKTDIVAAINEVLSNIQINLTSNIEEFEIPKAKFNWLRTRSTGAAADTTYAATAYDDSSWEEVNLPYDWSIDSAFDSNSSATYEGGYLNGGDAWYRFELPITKAMQGKNIFLNFEGVYQISDIYVNGTSVGKGYLGYNPFKIEITDNVSFTGVNVAAVYVTNRQPSSRYYSGSGIYRPVKLIVENQSEIAIEDIVVTTPNLATQKDGLVDTVVNCDVTGTYDEITVDILDADGNIVGSASDTTLPITVEVLRPQMWDIYQGNLYTARVGVKKGITTYIKTTWFGYRYISFDGSGFYLNGVHTFMKGVCLHHDLGCIGAEANTSAMARQLDIMIEMGVNAIRTSHNPEGENFLRLCAEKGLLVVEEFFDTWRYHKKSNDFATSFLDHWQEVVDTTVKRDRNNPAIVMWSIGNEVSASPYNSADGDYTNYRADAQMIHNRVKLLDSTRYTTTAQSEKGEAGYNLADVVDVIGLNYSSNSNYNTFHTLYPDKAIHGSETTSGLSSRGIYDYNNGTTVKGAMPSLEASRQCSSYDNNVVNWIGTANSAAEVLKYHANNFDTGTQTFGMFVWTGFDYIGEPTPFSGWPSKSSYFGIVDLAGFPKDIYYMYQSQWTTKPMIHILPMNWDYEANTTIPVWLYSNCEKVELFLNGESLGSKMKSQIGSKFQYEFNVDYVSGVLVANGYDANNVLVAQDMLFSSTNQAKGLSLKKWYNCIDYRTKDVAFIECDITDIYGVRLPTANNTVTFTVDGGTILGMDNGNATDTTSFHTNSRAAFNGKVLCVVRHDGKPGLMTITASAEGLGQKRITVEKGLYTGRTQEMPTAFVDATNPPEHPYTDAIVAPSSDSGTTKYSVSIDLVRISAGNPAIEVALGATYMNTLTPADGYEISSCTVTMGGVDISASAFNTTTSKITISNVSGDIVIMATAEAIGSITRYDVTKSGNHVIYSNSVLKVEENDSYTTNITPETGYRITSVIVTMGGVDITSTAYSNGIVTIAAVTGNIEITATAVAIVYHTITSSLLHVLNSNATTTIEENNSYTATLTAESTDYTIDEVVITMGETDITSTAYNNGAISIANVTDDIFIAATSVRETILRSNYSPNNSSFSDTVTVDFANGEYVVAEIDITNCLNNKIENILSIGTTIDIYQLKDSGLANQGVYHMYWVGSTGKPRVGISYSTTAGSGAYTTGTDLTGFVNPLVIKLKADGLYINGTKVVTNASDETTYVLPDIINADSILVGSLEGTARSHATYNYIKVVSDPANTPIYTITHNGTNTSLSNSATTVSGTDYYSTQILPSSGYEVTAITVTMGGVDITSTAVSGTDINIGTVTGNIVITSTAASAAWANTPVYSNTNLVFDGTTCVDTNVQLFDTDKSWKIDIDFAQDASQPTDVTVLHAMHEASPWPGFVLDRQKANYRLVTYNQRIDSVLSATSTANQTWTIEYSAPAHTLTLTKNGDTPTTVTGITYSTAVTETLLLGGYRTTADVKGRYWYGTINSINVYVNNAS